MGEFRDYIASDEARAKELIIKNVFGGIPFSESTKERKKLLVHLASKRIAGDNKEKYNKIFSYLMKFFHPPKPKLIKQRPFNKNYDSSDDNIGRMRFGKDWENDD